MPSADQLPVKSSHSMMRWHVWGVLIAGTGAKNMGMIPAAALP